MCGKARRERWGAVKAFSCGDVVPGCRARWECSTEDEILARVATHAAEAHGMLTIPDSVMSSVRAAMVTV